MPSVGNAVSGVAHTPLAVSQQIREELSLYAFNTPSISTVTAAAIDKLDQCDGIMKQFQTREEEIQVDALSSDQGKRVKMEAAAKEFFERLRFIAEAAEHRRQAALELRKELDTLPKAPGDPIIEEMRGQEIRTELRKLEPMERLKRKVFGFDPLDRKQPLEGSEKRKVAAILRALENDPMGPNVLIHDLGALKQIKESLVDADRAAELTRWKALVFVADKLQLVANVLDTTLGKYRLAVPTFPTPPVTHTDLGTKNPQAPPAKGAADKPTASQFQ